MSRSPEHSVPARVEFSFRERAMAEAARYGSDSWVFLRELLQNARDAGARRIELTVTEQGGTESLSCRDDGCGMSAFHAHRYLFALYASSKEGDTRQAGQFGVGFWSVLRFKPDKVVIRSRPRDGDAWRVELNHRLENAVFMAWEMDEGTEIVLERQRPRSRAGDDGSREGHELLPSPSGRGAGGEGSRPGRRPLADKVFDAVWRYGRFLTRSTGASGDEESPILLTVNGRPVHAEFELPAPSSSFHRRGFRGVVALAAEPRVELFANGLFVRQVACLEDLFEDNSAGDADDKSSLDLPGSLAPQVLLDSSRLEPLLARSDVRQTRHLGQMVATAEKELERLIERQLEAVRPLPWYVPLWSRLRRMWQRLGGRVWMGGRIRMGGRLRMAAWLAPMAVLGVVAGWFLAGWTVESPSRDPGRAPFPDPLSWRHAAFPYFRSTDAGYVGDLGASYLGPKIDPPADSGAPPRITYQPAHSYLFLTALVVESPESWALSSRGPVPEGPYEGRACPARDRGCVAIRLVAEEGDLRLPVPVGHLVDPDSVRRNGLPQSVLATASGEALVRELEWGDVLEYRTLPGEAPPSHHTDSSGSLPPRLKEVADALAGLPPDERVERALEQVRRLVAYDRSAETVRRRGEGFAEAALRVGRGDCDVQNGVLVMLLRETGMAARLAVGYVGREGRVAPGLHAWAEYQGSDRRWRLADASNGIASAGASRLRWGGPEPAGYGIVGSPLFLVAEAELGGPARLHALFGRFADRPEIRRIGASVLFGAALALSAALVLRRRGVQPARMRLGEPDLAALLGGALQHQGLARLPALVHGRFIPLIGPSRSPSSWRRRHQAISLHEAQRRAADGQLFSSALGSRLARLAADRGIPVINAALAEGRVSGLGLGAIDLDEWSDLLDRGTGSGLVGHLNAYLDSIGVNWRVALASPLSRPLKVVDLALLGLGRRQVLIDPRSADFAAAGPRLDLESDAAAFRLLDAVTDHLDLARCDRARLLAGLARRAVVEKHSR